MAAQTADSLPALLSKLTASLETATSTLPAAETSLTPENGISLLDVKSDLFLSYLQNLAFLILLKLRNAPAKDTRHIHDDVVKKLVELRIYLEKGVRPLEGRLKYQIDKVLRAADTADRDVAQKAAKPKPKARTRTGSKPAEASNDSDKEDAEEEEEDSDSSSESSIDDLAYRPNPAAFDTAAVKPARAPPTTKTGTSAGAEGTEVYRPPRITPTALPRTSTNPDDRAPSRSQRKPQRSRAIDDYISNEVSGAPAAEPSIGSTIISGGRTAKSDRERREDAERTAYEEANFVRLAPLTRKEKASRRAGREIGFGGEELRGLGEGLDRVARLTRKKRDGGGRATEDGPRGDGFGGSASGRPGKKRRVGR